jgi:hypothetical protein
LSPRDPLTARSEAMCLYWAKIAEATSEVRGFRREVLGGTTLAPGDARKLIHSPAAAVLSVGDFRAKKIPIVGHTAEFLRYEKSESFASPYWTRATVKTTWPGGENVTTRSRQSAEVLDFWDGEQTVSVETGHACVLQRLYRLAVHLARRYPWEPPLPHGLCLQANRRGYPHLRPGSPIRVT